MDTTGASNWSYSSDVLYTVNPFILISYVIAILKKSNTVIYFFRYSRRRVSQCCVSANVSNFAQRPIVINDSNHYFINVEECVETRIG